MTNTTTFWNDKYEYCLLTPPVENVCSFQCVQVHLFGPDADDVRLTAQLSFIAASSLMTVWCVTALRPPFTASINSFDDLWHKCQNVHPFK